MTDLLINGEDKLTAAGFVLSGVEYNADVPYDRYVRRGLCVARIAGRWHAWRADWSYRCGVERIEDLDRLDLVA